MTSEKERLNFVSIFYFLFLINLEGNTKVGDLGTFNSGSYLSMRKINIVLYISSSIVLTLERSDRDDDTSLQRKGSITSPISSTKIHWKTCIL